MSMRIYSAVAMTLALVACSSGQQPTGNAEFENAFAAADTQAADDGRIVCAPAGSGFHRLLVKPGYGVVAADGAEKAKVIIIGDGQIEVAIGGDRFRLPATVKGQKAAK